MDLIVLFGPPAAGKMTVGRALAARSRYRLFHNHMTIEPLLGLFSFDDPPFRRLVGSFRDQIVEACIEANAFDLIFTFVWAFDLPSEARYVRSFADRVAAAGGTTRYVELVCPQAERLQRNRTPERLDAKRSKRDLAASEANLRDLDARHRLTSAPGDRPEWMRPYLRIDNATLSAEDAAALIATRFDLAG